MALLEAEPGHRAQVLCEPANDPVVVSYTDGAFGSGCQPPGAVRARLQAAELVDGADCVPWAEVLQSTAFEPPYELAFEYTHDDFVSGDIDPVECRHEPKHAFVTLVLTL